jgi:hypothetical protein
MTISNLKKSLCTAALLASGVVLNACNDNTDLVDIVEDGEVGVVSLKTTSDAEQLAVGETVTLSTTATYDSGVQSAFSDTLRWISQNNAVATVSEDGTVTAVSPGETTISYHWRRISGSTTITVSDAELASIQFSSNELEAQVCSQATITATGLYTDGSTQTLPETSTWSSSDAGVVTIDSAVAGSATVLLLDSGSAQVTLTSESVANSLPIVVTDTLTELKIESASMSIETGTEQSIQVSGLYADGTDQYLDSAVVFTVSDPQNDASGGLLLDTHPEPTPDNADTNTPQSPEAQPSSPETDTTDTGTEETQTTETQTEGPEPSGAEPGEVIVAASPTLDIVRLEDSSLIVRAKQAGDATVSVNCGGQTGTFAFTVTEPAVIETIAFANTETDLESGEAVTHEITAHYSDSTEQTVTDDIQWTILSGDIDSFSLDPASGQVTANPDLVVEQSIVLQASHQNLTAIVEIVANRGIVEEVVETRLYFVDDSGESMPLTTAENTLTVGDTLQLSLKTVYNTGTELFSATDLFWSNLNPQIASIDGAGLLTAHSAGISSIVAIRDNSNATFQFTVVEDPDPPAAATPVTP